MLLGFIGCPSSGKTTSAAICYARLKKDSMAVELVPEQARIYIAERRIELQLVPEDGMILTDEDQKGILDKQSSLERLFVRACGPNVIIISDGCIYNSLLYMSPEAVFSTQVAEILGRSVQYDMLFYCPPVRFISAMDPCRVHSEAEARLIDAKIPAILEKCVPPTTKVISLKGNPERRASEVVYRLYDELGL